MRTRDLLILCFNFLCSVAPGLAQGTFQNLGFEQANLVPVSANAVQFAPAFPGWSGFIGGVQASGALYNNLTLDTAAISILDHGWPNPFGGPGGLIQGNFTALLIAGLSSTLPGAQPVNVTLAQTGRVPVNTESLEFRAYTYSTSLSGSFVVTLGGQTLSLIPLQTGGNYTLYGADVHGFAGQTAELDFTVIAEQPHMNNEYLFLDSIQFSPQVIPEPGVLELSALGVLLLAWRMLGGGVERDKRPARSRCLAIRDSLH
jgi:hypothetical protein